MNDNIKSCIEESTKKIKETIEITPKIAGEIAESCKAKFKKEETPISVSKPKSKFPKIPTYILGIIGMTLAGLTFGGWFWFWVALGLVGLFALPIFFPPALTVTSRILAGAFTTSLLGLVISTIIKSIKLGGIF